MNPEPLHWERRVLATGLPGKSPSSRLYTQKLFNKYLRDAFAALGRSPHVLAWLLGCVKQSGPFTKLPQTLSSSSSTIQLSQPPSSSLDISFLLPLRLHDAVSFACRTLPLPQLLLDDFLIHQVQRLNVKMPLPPGSLPWLPESSLVASPPCSQSTLNFHHYLSIL